MKFVGKTVIVFIIFGAISIIFLTWHSLQHSREEDLSNKKETLERVLIATESEKSKDSVVAVIIGQLTSPSIDIHTIEISQLRHVNEHHWSAIVILSTPENLAPQKEVRAFIENTDINNKIVLLSLSGSMVEIVDFNEISTAGMNKIPATPDEIVSRIKSMINK